MIAKINTWLAIHLLSGWKANVILMTLTPSVNNSKSKGTQMPFVQMSSLYNQRKLGWCIPSPSTKRIQTHKLEKMHKARKRMLAHMPANTPTMTCLHWYTWHSCTHAYTHFSTTNIPVSSLWSLWQPVSQRRNTSLDYSFLSYSLVVVLGSSQDCWLADSVADRN